MYILAGLCNADCVHDFVATFGDRRWLYYIQTLRRRDSVVCRRIRVVVVVVVVVVVWSRASCGIMSGDGQL